MAALMPYYANQYPDTRCTVCGIVLAYGTHAELFQAVASLDRAIDNGRIILVQNGLAYPDLTELAAQFPRVHVVPNRENRGAAGGRNLGLQAANAYNPEYVFFLDRDATVEPDALEKAIQAVEQLPDAGLVSCLILGAENHSHVHSSGGRFDPSTLEEIHLREFPSTSVSTVDFVVTTAAIVRASVLEQVGMFDERFFAYQEDIDWAFRASNLGYKHYVIRESVAYHTEARSRFHPLVAYYLTRNKLLFWLEQGFIQGKGDARVWQFVYHTARYYFRQMQVFAPLATSCFLAHLIGWIDFRRNRFGRGPAWLERPGEMYFESRIRNRLRCGSLMGTFRSPRRLRGKSKM